MKQLLVIFISLFLLIACKDNKDGNIATEPDKADSSKAEKEESREDRNKKIIKEFMAALNDHNMDKLTSMMADNVVDRGDGTQASVKGKDSVKVAMDRFMTAFPDFKADNLRYFADEDQVVVTGEYSGTFKKDMGKHKATGKKFKFQDADIFTLNDAGLITEHRFIQPDATLFGQVGVSTKQK
jgi:steroid delta-isomerase-like uncharacterized protein